MPPSKPDGLTKANICNNSAIAKSKKPKLITFEQGSAIQGNFPGQF
jgi:hypothetical protein